MTDTLRATLPSEYVPAGRGGSHHGPSRARTPSSWAGAELVREVYAPAGHVLGYVYDGAHPVFFQHANNAYRYAAAHFRTEGMTHGA